MRVDYESKESVETFKCIAKNVKSVLTKYNDLKDDKQKGQLVKSTLTALINNECIATIFEKLPFDKIEDEIEKNNFDLDIKDIIKLLEKIEKAKDFDDIQDELTDFM
jgi:DNA polymerase III sliding clamp (beta) subunit (PCNA family)